MTSRVLSLCLVFLVAVAAFAAFRLLEASLAAEVYRSRLGEIAEDYEELRGRYNQAVRRTAVTELLVHDGRLTVVIRTAEGELQSFDSPFDPSQEIYVDYVVRNGRLWIRRVFDGDTPPKSGMQVDPRLVDIDWDDEGANHGKAAYRSLSEGRWVIDVTGDGSLGLSKRPAGETRDLGPPPPVRRYEPIDEVVNEVLGSIRPSEVLDALARQLRLGA